LNDYKPEVKIKEVIRLEITAEITGYTIQALKGLDYIFSDPVVIVPTYKTNILSLTIDEKGNILLQENKGSFSVTRDAWYNRGKNSNGKYVIMNRAFIPSNYKQNLYGLRWIPNYPTKFKIVASGLDAYIFTRFGSNKIPAKPLPYNKNLDGSDIDDPREDPNFAIDVMIHIGGTYEFYMRGISYKGNGYDWVAGSLGCFAYIPDHMIYENPKAAKKAVENDDYDDETSNKSWKEVSNKIKKLSFSQKKELQVILRERDESKNYFPKEILQE
jgi:hypothetical protein